MTTNSRIERLHAAACARGDAGYIDPYTGMMVLTADYLQGRGECCWAGCRHCPWSPRHKGPRRDKAEKGALVG